MNGLTTLGTVLAVIFPVSLLLLIAQLFLVLWRRRRFLSRNISIADTDSQRDSFYTQAKSKELLYFFCWISQTRVEPADSAQPLPPPQGESVPPDDDDELLKWQILYGQSRLLFTIKEEEKEELDSEKGTNTRTVSIETLPEVSVTIETLPENSVTIENSPENSVTIETSPENSVTIDLDDTTPFSTPCPSPPYYTPSSSPTRDSR